MIETFAARVGALRSDGSVEPVAEVRGTMPDGLALDADGGFLIGCHQPNRILRAAPDGSVTTVLDDPTGLRLFTPTNLAFHGERLDRLAIASLGGWAVSSIRVPWRGQLLAYP